MRKILPYTTIAGPLLTLFVIARAAGGRETPADLAERLVRDRRPGPAAPLWVHGASVGEVTAARPAIEAMIATAGSRAVLTVNTTSARAIARGWAIDGLTVRLAPIDSRAALRRFLARFRPAALINLEAEFWPLRFSICRARGIAVIGLGTRFSSEQARARGAIARARRAAIARYSEIWPLDADSRDALAAAGVGVSVLRETFNAKVLAPPGAGNGASAAPDLEAWRGAPVLLAASPHAGEQALLAETCAKLAAARPQLRFVIAPRHPALAADFARALTAAGLVPAIRSRGDVPTPATRCYIADTLAEMPLWYRAAPVTIVCGSFVDAGGHTPAEPVWHGSFPISGPDRANHAEAYAALSAVNAAAFATDADSLATAVAAALDDPALPARVAAGRDALAGLSDTMRARLDRFVAGTKTRLEAVA